MNEQRFVKTDHVLQRLKPHLPGKASDAGPTAKDNCLFLEAVFCRVRTGSPWCHLPPAFGNWNSQFRRFRRWSKAGVSESLFIGMSGDPDLEYALIDGTIVHGTSRQPMQKYGPPRLHAAIFDDMISLHKRIRHVGTKAAAKMKIRASQSS